MFSAGKKRFTGGFLFIQKKAAFKAARSIKNRAGFAGLFGGDLAVGNLVLSLLCSAGLCASEMVAQVNLATASLGLLVLKAPNREPEVLEVAVQVRKVAVVAQAHAVRVVAIVLGRTPEVRVVALVDVIPTAVPEASRQRREGIGIRAIATSSIIIIPAFRGL